MVVLHDFFSFLLQKVVSFLAFLFLLSNFESKEGCLLVGSLDLPLELVDALGLFLVVIQHLSVPLRLGVGVSHVLGETVFKLVVQLFDLLDEVVLHGLEILYVLVLDLLSRVLVEVLHVVQLLLLLLFDGLDHVSELLPFLAMRLPDL